MSEVGTGNLKLTSSGAGVEIQKSQTEYLGRFLTDGAVELYHDNSKKFETNSGGVSITGHAYFPDNNGVHLGAGEDFKIYHDGTSNIFQSNGLKNFIFRPKDTDVGLKVIGDGGVELYYDNSKKLETTSTGVDITGNLHVDALPNTTTNSYLKIAIQDTDGTLKSDDTVLINPAQDAMKVNGLHLSNNHVRAANNGPLQLTTANANGTVDVNIKHTHVEINGNLLPATDSTDNLGADATRWSNLYADTLYGDGSNLTGIAAFPSGTKMLFAQSAAPTGWTKDTANNDRALRVVNGTTGGTQGGTNGFTTKFNNSVATSGGAVNNHTLTTAQMPSHNHGMQQKNAGLGCGGNHSYTGVPGTFGCGNNSTGFSTFNTGGGSAHNHSFSNPNFNLDVKYVNVIIANKD